MGELSEGGNIWDEEKALSKAEEEGESVGKSIGRDFWTTGADSNSINPYTYHEDCSYQSKQGRENRQHFAWSQGFHRGTDANPDSPQNRLLEFFKRRERQSCALSLVKWAAIMFVTFLIAIGMLIVFALIVIR